MGDVPLMQKVLDLQLLLCNLTGLHKRRAHTYQ